MNDFDNSAGTKRESSSSNFLFHKGPLITLFCGFIMVALALLSVLAGNTIFSFILFGLIVAVSVVLYIIPSRIIKSLIYKASEILFTPLGMSDREAAFQFLYDFILYGRLPMVFFNDGKLDEKSQDSSMTKLGLRGPGIAVVGEGTGILVERQEGQFGVVGPGSHILREDERIRGAVDLRLQQGEYDLADVFTRDGVPLQIRLSVLYRIIQSEDMLWRRGRYEVNAKAVTKALLSARNWKQQIDTVTKTKVRDLVVEYDLEQIYGVLPQPSGENDASTENLSEKILNAESAHQSIRVPFQKALEDSLNEEMMRWGVQVAKVALYEIKVPGEVTKQMIEGWGIRWKTFVKAKESEMDAQSVVTKARGQEEAAVIEARATTIRVEADARAKLRAAEIDTEADSLRTRRKAESERAAASITAETKRILADAEADSLIVQGRAEAEARAEIFRRVVAALQMGGGQLDSSTLGDLARALASTEERRDVDRAIRRAFSDSEIAPRASSGPTRAQVS